MTDYGVTANGFVKKPYSVIHDEIVEEYRNKLGRSIDLSDESPDGQIISINAVQIASLWDALEGSYYAKYPHTATGVSLDNACLATNSKRERAKKSTTTLTFTGAANTIVPMGTLVETSTGLRVETTATGIIAPGNTMVTVAAAALTTGPIVTVPGTLTKLTSPISGIESVTNLTDLLGGRDDEADADFKKRRIAELQRPGKPTSDGIRNQLLTLDWVSKAIVVSNKGDTTDTAGRPPHSIECFITANITGALVDEANADKRAQIAEVIFKSKAAGIQTWGTISEVVTDTEGSTETIKFSEPTPVDIIIQAVLTVNTNPAEGPLFPDDGIDNIKRAILDYGATLGSGQDVWVSKIYNCLMSEDGVKSVFFFKINDALAPIDISIESTQISRWLLSNLDITIQ